MCVRDDKQWKDCDAGHETVDWVRQIEKAYNEKNSPLVVEDLPSFVPSLTLPTATLLKRQDNNTTNTMSPGPPPPSGSDNNNNNPNQGAPLSVFVSVSYIAFCCGYLERGWSGINVKWPVLTGHLAPFVDSKAVGLAFSIASLTRSSFLPL